MLCEAGMSESGLCETRVKWRTFSSFRANLLLCLPRICQPGTRMPLAQ